MNWIAWVILAILFLISGGLFVAILIRQKELDAPVKGLLVIDCQDPEHHSEVYLKGAILDRDPKTFTDGELIKLEVCVITGNSQGKHATE